MVATPSWLVPANATAEFYTPERCYITELLNNDASPQVSVAVARVLPGITTQLHSLTGITETYVLRSGSGVVEIEGQLQAVTAGDQVIIAPGLAQRIQNTGTSDLQFYCVCTPRFTPECYIDLESATEISPNLI